MQGGVHVVVCGAGWGGGPPVVQPVLIDEAALHRVPSVRAGFPLEEVVGEATGVAVP